MAAVTEDEGMRLAAGRDSPQHLGMDSNFKTAKPYDRPTIPTGR